LKTVGFMLTWSGLRTYLLYNCNFTSVSCNNIGQILHGYKILLLLFQARKQASLFQNCLIY